jgi:hypothetical protein
LRSLDSQNPHAHAYSRLILRVHVSDPLCIHLYPDVYPDCRVVLATFTGAGGGSLWADGACAYTATGCLGDYLRTLANAELMRIASPRVFQVG